MIEANYNTGTPSKAGNYIAWYNFRTIVAVHWSKKTGWQLVDKNTKPTGRKLDAPKYYITHPVAELKPNAI